MSLDVLLKIYEAVKDKKWLYIDYVNTQKKSTSYYIGINDIDFKNDRVFCEIFNPTIDYDTMEDAHPIILSNIVNARVVDNTYYESSKTLINKLDERKETSQEFNDACLALDNNIISYLSECYKYDNDPYLREEVMIDGIDLESLSKEYTYQLNDEQFISLVNDVFKKDEKDAEYISHFKTLCLNVLSIDCNDKEFVVAYRPLSLNFANKTLSMTTKSLINKSFLIDTENESLRKNITSYLDVDLNDFCSNFDSKKEDFINELRINLYDNEKINTRPLIFILERNYDREVYETLNTISQLNQENKLTPPLKAFFNCNLSRGGEAKTNKNSIVVSNKNKINIEQIRAIYNGLSRHITYVKGPPGTGKTETIYNLVLSAVFNKKSVLLASNNNHPMNDLYEKFKENFCGVNPQFSDEFITFPIIRLGNRQTVIKTILYLRNLINYLIKNKDKFKQIKPKLDIPTDNRLKDLLTRYEQITDIEEEKIKLTSIQLNNPIKDLDDGIKRQINLKEVVLFRLKDGFNEKDILNAVEELNENNELKEYFDNLFIQKALLLLDEKYKKLREIILYEKDLNESGKEFDKYLKNDANLHDFLKIFPIIISTNLSSGKLGSIKPIFDLVVIDEAAQCNMVTSLMPMIRGKSILLVGDTNQLKPVTILDEGINEYLMDKYHIDKSINGYDYNRNSILSVMLNKDKNSKVIFLKEHYRCAKKIIRFPNSRYYKNQLQSLNKNEGTLTYVNVKNQNRENRNAYIEEALAIVRLIINKRDQLGSNISIITPFNNQAKLINNYLKENNIFDITAGTIHTVQGSECDTIILSSAISLKTAKKTMKWINDNHEIINVAATRAKKHFVFVADKEAIDTLSNVHFKDDRGKNEIKALSDYVYSNGTTVVYPSTYSLDNFSNDSLNEKEFFKTISPYFNYRRPKFKIERNVALKSVIKTTSFDDKKLIGKKELDVVIYAKHGFSNYVPVVAFEISGGEHIGKHEQRIRDKEKQTICSRYGLKLLIISNDNVKDYETIIKLFESCVNKTDMDSIQGSLFEDE